MLSQESQVEIFVLHKQGKGIRAIARALGLSRNTVRSALRGQRKKAYERIARVTKVTPYTDYLTRRLAAAGEIKLASTVLLREIREQGYDGGITQLKLFLRSIRPQKAPETIVRFETPPGEQLQIDFVVLRRGENPLRAFTATMGYSRMSYVHFTDNERAETWIACLEEALAFFGGVPRKVLCDNPKAVVIERHAYGEGKHRFHPLFNDFAKHYGIDVKLCAPYRAQTKGNVERFHRYFRESFYRPLQTRLAPIGVDVAAANRAVRVWLDDVANVRLHATLKERPIDRFAVEKLSLAMLPLPYSGRPLLRSEQSVPVVSSPVPFESFQHPLSIYEYFAAEVAG
jgi:transposase